MTTQDNLFFDVEKEICGILNGDSSLSSVDFIPENKKDLETQLTGNLRKQGICGIVLVENGKYLGNKSNGNPSWEMNPIVVQVVENPVVNRSEQNKKYCGTSQDVIAKCCDVLGFGNCLSGAFNLIGVEFGENDGLVVGKLNLKTVCSK